MSAPDSASVFMVRAPDRLALIDMRDDTADALAFCKDLHAFRAEIHVSPRYDNAPQALPERKRSPMPARFPGRCAACAQAVSVGMPIYFDSETRRVTHARCA